jgi:hypothetical protein
LLVNGGYRCNGDRGDISEKEFCMKLTTDCPNCGFRITSKRWNDQDWFLCGSCQSVFFSHERLRESWPILYNSFEEKDKDLDPAV